MSGIREFFDHRRDARLASRPRSGPPAGVLLVAAGGLGDTVLFSLVADRFARLAEHDERVTVLLRADAAQMAFLLPPEIKIEVVDFAHLAKQRGYRRGIFARLFAANYRLVVSTDYRRHPNLDEALVRACHAAGAAAMEPRPWAKYDGELDRNRALYDRLFDSGPALQDKVLRWARFADWLLASDSPPPTARLDLARFAPGAVLDAPTVVIQPFSAVTQKQSPAALYEQIIAALPAGTRTVITGAPGACDDQPEFSGLLDLEGVTFDSCAFEELVPLLRAAVLVISVDTALMHLAAVLGAPTLCLASAAFVGEIVPYAPATAPPNVRFMHTPMDCQGCLGVCIHPPEDGMYPCVAALDAATVLAAVDDLLAIGESAP